MILVNFMNMLNGLGLNFFYANPKEAYYSTFIECECCTKGFFFSLINKTSSSDYYFIVKMTEILS